ncbi:alpha/beta-hydrolase [Fistulina hepatica ATCC 64428]|uniref:Alpha/beta-hydrolase n=1 Tax=Fistulina hepatica ATCC 64428 TaxID=1128425 RepID=A0A0D7A508_9AGAR|nr:alpha/beta-hydrolase [Fistulina hepatica ATCC 64428]
MSFCADCVRGMISTPSSNRACTGKIEKINGVECYVASPEIDYPKDKVVLFLPDVFGHLFINNQLVADSYALNGFKTVIPDYLNGDPIPPDAMGPGNGFDINKWFVNHGKEQTRPTLDKAIAGLREQGVTTFAASGYCYGGRYTFDLAFENIIKVAVVAHPSLLQIPADLEKYAASSFAPLLINSCETDQMFPQPAQAQADEILGSFAPGYKREYWAGCVHGFAVRGDLDNPQVKAGKEGAFKSSVEWLVKYL